MSMFGLFDAMFFVVFALVIGVFVGTAFKGLRQWNRNNNSPRLTVEATVVTKRMSVSHHRHDHHYHSTDHYYVTFQFDSGDRMELSVPGSEYGMLVEGDVGNLTFQGTRYLGFIRT